MSDLAREATARLLDEQTGLELAARAVTATPLSIVITAATDDEPIVWANEGFFELTGYTAEEVLGRSCRVLQGPNTDQKALARLAADLRAGRTAAETLLNYRRDSTPFWNRMVITPVRDAEGRITHHMGIHTDATVQVMTEQARAAELELEQSTSGRLKLLTQVTDALAEHLEYHEAADAMADIAIPPLADWGFVALFDQRGAFEHLRVTTADPEKADIARRLEDADHTWVEMSEEIREALRATPDDVLMPKVIDTAYVAENTSPDHADLLTSLGLGSWLLVPLFARDRTLGLLALVSENLDGFPVHTVVTAIYLGRRVGLALDNARLYLSERCSALTLQHRLLPRALDVPGIDVSATYLPSAQQAEVGGDWYDVLPLGDGEAVLTVGDVAGHDMPAAAAMGQISSLLRARQWGGESPAQVLDALASLMTGLGWDDVASIVSLRCRTSEAGIHVEYVNAGHSPPFVRLPDGTVNRLPLAHTLPVGLLDPTAVHQDELDLPVGSLVVLYTDGLVERRDRTLGDGMAALAQALREAPAGTAEQVRDHLVRALVDEHPEDDVCLLVARWPGPSADLSVDQP